MTQKRSTERSLLFPLSLPTRLKTYPCQVAVRPWLSLRALLSSPRKGHNTNLRSSRHIREANKKINVCAGRAPRVPIPAMLIPQESQSPSAHGILASQQSSGAGHGPGSSSSSPGRPLDTKACIRTSLHHFTSLSLVWVCPRRGRCREQEKPKKRRGSSQAMPTPVVLGGGLTTFVSPFPLGTLGRTSSTKKSGWPSPKRARAWPGLGAQARPSLGPEKEDRGEQGPVPAQKLSCLGGLKPSPCSSARQEFSSEQPGSQQGAHY